MQEFGRSFDREYVESVLGAELAENIRRYNTAKERVLKYLGRKCHKPFKELPKEIMIRLATKYKINKGESK